MTYFWAEGSPIQVQPDLWDAPVWFIWEEETHTVWRVVQRWRVDEEWWQARIWREYFRLITHSGLLVVVFQNLTTRQWYLERLYD